jgi:lipid A ethanolaminephosphotransferase
VPHQNVTDLKLSGQCIDGECYDEVLFHNLDSYIDNLQQDGIIVLHTIGSHGPTYYNRYPAQFKQFTPTCDTNEIQSCTQQQLTNTYDNTILYVDYVVDKAIKLLQSKQDKFTTSLVYLSDHGESLARMGSICTGCRGPSRRRRKNVPMLLWLSRIINSAMACPASVCSKAKTQAYSQDNLFSTLLGLLGVSTREYQATDDILTPCRGRPMKILVIEDDALLLQG